MNTSKLNKFAWVFFALTFGATTLFAQGFRNGNRGFNYQNYSCLNQLSDLTKDQISKIQELENNHQEAMNELRIQRRSTIVSIEKNEIRGDMLKKVASHREAVKKLLTGDQQKQYELLHYRGNNFRNQNLANQRGNRFNQGRRGNFGGQQQFVRGNRRGCLRNGNRNRANFGQGNQRFNRQNIRRNSGNSFRGRNRNSNGRGLGNGYNLSNS